MESSSKSEEKKFDYSPVLPHKSYSSYTDTKGLELDDGDGDGESFEQMVDHFRADSKCSTNITSSHMTFGPSIPKVIIYFPSFILVL